LPHLALNPAVEAAAAERDKRAFPGRLNKLEGKPFSPSSIKDMLSQ
jgi:hypothetical protein